VADHPPGLLRRAHNLLKPNKAVPLLWRQAILGYIAMALAGYLSWQAGFRPSAAQQAADAHLSLGSALNIEYELMVVARVLPACLVALFVVLLATLVPRKQGPLVAWGTGVLSLVALALAWVALRSPWLMGPITAVVMGGAVLAPRRGRLVGAVASLFSMVYFIYAVIGLGRGYTDPELLLQGLLGLAAGLVVLFILWIIKSATGRDLARGDAPDDDPPAPPAHAVKAAPAKVPFFSGGPLMRYAIARGVLLGVGAGIYAAQRDLNFFWVLLTVWVVLQATPDKTVAKSFQRVVAVMFACLIVAGLALFVTPDIMVLIALGSFFTGVLYLRRSWPVYTGGWSILMVVAHGGLADDHFGVFAGLRLLDTLIGIAIGMAAAYLTYRVFSEGEDDDHHAPPAPATGSA